MNKILTIGIPHYKEVENQMKLMLSMIDCQIGIDFNEIEVIICNDGSDVLLSDEFLNSFINFTPIYIRREINGGPGLCRQHILDNMNGEYIMFIDSGDLLHNCAIVGLYLNLIKVNPDRVMFQTSWLEELKQDDGTIVYSEHKQDFTWLHGKCIKKSFIDECKVRFHQNLRIHEDSYFLGLLGEYCTADNLMFIDTVSYVWRWYDDSITRNNNSAYTYESIPIFIDSISHIIDELIGRGLSNEKVTYRVLQLIIYIYLNQQLNHWQKDENESHRYSVERSLKYFMGKYQSALENSQLTTFNNIYNQEREKILVKNGEMEKENFNVYKERIMNTNYIVELCGNGTFCVGDEVIVDDTNIPMTIVGIDNTPIPAVAICERMKYIDGEWVKEREIHSIKDIRKS